MNQRNPTAIGSAAQDPIPPQREEDDRTDPLDTYAFCTPTRAASKVTVRAEAGVLVQHARGSSPSNVDEMISVERLRQELMANLNIVEQSPVDNQGRPPSTVVSRNHNIPRRRQLLGRRPTSAGSARHSQVGIGEDRVRVGMDSHRCAFQQKRNSTAQQRCLSQGKIEACGVGGSAGAGGSIKDYGARPSSAKSRAYLWRNRPGTPNISTENGGVSSREMDVLMRICQDQGKGRSFNPTDFDSSVSAIINLPVGPFMSAAKDGWGQYFRALHGKQVVHDPRGKRDREGASRASSRVDISRAKRRQHDKRQTTARSHPLSASSPRTTTTCEQIGTTGVNPRKPQRNYRRRRASDSAVDDNEESLSAGESRVGAGERRQLILQDDSIRRMATRLQILWNELKIPQPDRAYITATYLRGSLSVATRGKASNLGGRTTVARLHRRPTKEEVQSELMRQVTLLLAYRAATIKVLQTIDERESRLTEVKQALRSFQWHRGRDMDADSLLAALMGLRDTSLRVVRAIMAWRRQLWQPRAFCWRNVKYLEKMAQDAGFLRTPVGENLLASIGLTTTDMIFVLFPVTSKGNNAENIIGGSSEDSTAKSDATMTDVLPPPNIVRLTPKAKLATEYRLRFFCDFLRDEGDIAVAATAGPGSPAVDTATATTTAAGIAKEETLVVLQETALQNRVREERKRLATQGCFVPLLRWLPVEKNVSKRRPHSATSAFPDSSRRTNGTAAVTNGIYDESSVNRPGGGQNDNVQPTIPAMSSASVEDERGGKVGAHEEGRRSLAETHEADSGKGALMDGEGVHHSRGRPHHVFDLERSGEDPTALQDLALEKAYLNTRSKMDGETKSSRTSRPGFRGSCVRLSRCSSGDSSDLNGRESAPIKHKEPTERKQAETHRGMIIPLPERMRQPLKDQAPESFLEPPRTGLADDVEATQVKRNSGPPSGLEMSAGVETRKEANDVPAPVVRDSQQSIFLNNSHINVESSGAEAGQLTAGGKQEAHSPSSHEVGGTWDDPATSDVHEDDDTEKTTISNASSCFGDDVPSRQVPHDGLMVGTQPQSRDGMHERKETGTREPVPEPSISSLLYDDDFEGEEGADYVFTDSEGYDSQGQGDTEDAPTLQRSVTAEASQGAGAFTTDAGASGRDRRNAAASIQRAWRHKSAVERKSILSRQRRAAQESAAARIQSAIRLAAARRRRRENNARRYNSAVKIQALARRRVAERQAQTRRIKKTEALLRTQSFAEEKHALTEERELRRRQHRHRPREVARDETDDAAVKIQRMVRRQLGGADHEPTTGHQKPDRYENDEASRSITLEPRESKQKEGSGTLAATLLNEHAAKTQPLARRRTAVREVRQEQHEEETQKRKSNGFEDVNTGRNQQERQGQQELREPTSERDDNLDNNTNAARRRDPLPSLSPVSDATAEAAASQSPLLGPPSPCSLSGGEYDDSFQSSEIPSRGSGGLSLSSDESSSVTGTRQVPRPCGEQQQQQHKMGPLSDRPEQRPTDTRPSTPPEEEIPLLTASLSVSQMKPDGSNNSVADLNVASSNLCNPQPRRSDESLMSGLRSPIDGGSGEGGGGGDGGGSAYGGQEWRGNLIALSPVSEEKTVVDTSDYGSDDLAFDALSDTSDSASHAGLPTDIDNVNSGDAEGSGVKGSTGRDLVGGCIQEMGQDTPDKPISDDSVLSIDMSSSSD